MRRVVIVVAVGVAVGVAGWRSSQHSQQVDEGEDPDPDQVEEVPEQRQAGQPALVGGDQPALADLHHQHDQPDDAEGDVQPVGADQREEGGEEARALRPGALVDQVGELVELDRDEAGAEEAGDGEPPQRPPLVAARPPPAWRSRR